MSYYIQYGKWEHLTHAQVLSATIVNRNKKKKKKFLKIEFEGE